MIMCEYIYKCYLITQKSCIVDIHKFVMKKIWQPTVHVKYWNCCNKLCFYEFLTIPLCKCLSMGAKWVEIVFQKFPKLLEFFSEFLI